VYASVCPCAVLSSIITVMGAHQVAQALSDDMGISAGNQELQVVSSSETLYNL